MNQLSEINLAYVALLALSLPIPLLHHYQTERAIESMRPFFKMADGSLCPMLMPADILLLRWLGQLSWWFPFIDLGMLTLSFWRQLFTRFSTVFTLAVCQCAFTTLYAVYVAWELGSTWLRR